MVLPNIPEDGPKGFPAGAEDPGVCPEELGIWPELGANGFEVWPKGLAPDEVPLDCAGWPNGFCPGMAVPPGVLAEGSKTNSHSLYLVRLLYTLIPTPSNLLATPAIPGAAV